MNILILISIFIVYNEGKETFHERLSTDEVKHYFGTHLKDEIPEYEFISPQKLTTQQDKDGTEDSHHQYLLTAFKNDYHLKLYKNQHLISPGCLLREVGENDTEYIIPCPLEELDCVYHGHSANHSGSWAAISTCDGLHGVVSVPQHDLMIQPVRIAHRHLIEQTTDNAHGIIPHLVYKKQKYTKKCAGSETGNSTNLHNMPNNSRRRRATGRKTMEVKVVVAPDSYHFHRDDTRRFAIAVMNIAAQRFLDSSLGQKIYMSLVELKILKAEPSDLKIVADADALLHTFCRWQSNNQPQDDSDPTFADNVVLITRTNLFYLENYSTTGFGLSSGTCKMTEKCSVNEDQGLGTGFTIAHETGHTLGMSHDGDGNNCASNRYMMSASGGGSEWSACSREALQRFLSSTSSGCLNDSPTGRDISLSNSRKKPGEIYSKDAQCRLAMKDLESKACEGTILSNGDECKQLVCTKPNTQLCAGLGRPRMDGTECGNRKWCINARCVAMGANSPRPIDGGWSAYESEWSDCTRTCGGGVKIKRRWCNNPEPRYGGRPCNPPQEYLSKLCNMQKCPTHSSPFKYREEQCSSLDKDPFNGRLFHWIPLIGDGRCRFFCKASGSSETRTLTHFHDGTECTSDSDFGRCIGGKCSEFGCDGHLSSPLRFDRCSVCGGSGNTCTPRSGIYNQGRAKQYVAFVTIPKGSTGILITNDNTFSYMSISVNNRLIFGQSQQASSGNYASNGVEVKYNKRPEKIKIVGPIPVAIQAKVYRNYGDGYVGVRPDIRYTYHVPNGQIHNNVYQWKTTTESCSRSCGTGTVRVTVSCMRGQQVTDDFHCNIFTKPAESVTPCNTQDCPPEWFSGEWGECTATCGIGTKQRTVSCVVIQGDDKKTVADNRCNLGRKPLHVQSCSMGECNGVWKSEAWSTCSTTCSNGVKTRTVRCYKDKRYNQILPDNSCSARKPPVTAVCLTQPCDFTKSGASCTDKEDCASYGSNVCHGQFESWSKENCALYCGYCVKDPSQYHATCEDSPDCRGRDTSVCTEYKEWSETNCKKLCNLCSAACEDARSDCANYPADTCQSYPEWARENCKKHCNLCTARAATTPASSHASTCVDKHQDCASYGKSACQNYAEWAKDNCQKYCNLCPAQSAGTDSACADKHQDCAGYGKSACQDYPKWASENCQKYCNLCQTQSGCVDTNKDCAQYGRDTCQNYPEWAHQNCQKFCNLCGSRRKRSAIPEPVNHYLAPPPLPKIRNIDVSLPKPPEQMVVPTPRPLGKTQSPLHQEAPEVNLKDTNGDEQSPQIAEVDQNSHQGLPPEEGGQVVIDVPMPKIAVEISDDTDYEIPPPLRNVPVSENEMFENPDNISDKVNDNQKDREEKQQLIEQLDDLRERD